MLSRREVLGGLIVGATLASSPAKAWFPHGVAGDPPAPGLTFITPGSTAYRSWAIDNTDYASVGASTDYGYTEVPTAQWVNGMYDRFTGTYWIGVAAWKGPRLVDVQAGKLRGIQKVEFSCDNGPWLEVDTPITDPTTGIEAYWAGLKASDFAASRTSEIRAKVTPICGKPFVLQGRSAAGPGGQAPTYDTTAGPAIWNWDGTGDGKTRTLVNTSVDARLWRLGAAEGTSGYQNLAYWPSGWSLIVNVDTGDGLLPSNAVYIDPVGGSDGNNGLTTGTAVQTIKGAAAAMLASCGTSFTRGGSTWTDYGGTNVYLMAGTHCLQMDSQPLTAPTAGFFSAADQWVTIRPAPGVDPSLITCVGDGSATGYNTKPYGLIAEKLRFQNLHNIYQVGLIVDAGGAASYYVRYGDVRLENCRYIGTGITVTSGPVFSVKVTNGGSGYTSAPAVSIPGITGATFTAHLNGDAVSSVTVSGTSSTCADAAAVTFSGGGGSGAAGRANIMYAGQPNSPVGINTGGVCKGHVEVIGDPTDYANDIDNYKDMGGDGINQLATLVRHIRLNNMSSQRDIFPGTKRVFHLKIRNSGEWIDPATGTVPGSQNHFDLLQPYNQMYNAIYEDVDTDASCLIQPFLADQFAPLINCAIIRPKFLVSGTGIQGAWYNTYCLQPDVSNWKTVMNAAQYGPQIGWNAQLAALEAVNGKDNRVVITDEIAQAAGNLNPGGDITDQLNFGLSFIYPGTPSEPLDKALDTTLSGLFDAGTLIDLLDATITGAVRVRSAGPSGRTDPRVSMWWDATNHPQGSWIGKSAVYAGGSQIIRGVTNANPGVFNVTGHGYKTGKRVFTSLQTGFGVGMTGIYGTWFANVIDADHFTLTSPTGTPLDTTSLGTYTMATNADGTPKWFAQVNERPQVAQMLETTDLRRPQFLASGYNSLPCIAFNVGSPTNNDASVTDQALPLDIQPMWGVAPAATTPHEVWFIGVNEHPDNDTNGTTQTRYIWSYGSGQNSVCLTRKWNAASGGYAELHGQVGITYTPSGGGSANLLVDIATDAAFGSTKGAFIARVEAKTDSVVLTVWNAAHTAGVSFNKTFASAIPGGATSPFLNIINNRGGIGGDGRFFLGSQGTFCQQRTSALVFARPQSAGAVSAIVAEGRSRLGF